MVGNHVNFQIMLFIVSELFMITSAVHEIDVT